MCLNLNDYQFKTSRYSYRSTYMNPMVIIYQKPTIYTQRLERKEHRNTTKESHQTTKEENKKKKNKQRRLQKQWENK